MFEKHSIGHPPLKDTVLAVLVIWLILLALGAPFGLMVSAMAFEGDSTLDTYLWLIAVWSYPLLIAIAFFYRRRKSALVWLPLLTILYFIFAVPPVYKIRTRVSGRAVSARRYQDRPATDRGLRTGAVSSLRLRGHRDPPQIAV